MILYILSAVALLLTFAWAAHYISYHVIKNRTLRERRWDYNICCGTTDGGGINADIMRHGNVPRFELIKDVTRLAHGDKAFGHVLCSHTIEHVEDPAAMFAELRRVGRNVTLLVPPLWDFTAAFHPLEHQVIFLTLQSRHDNHLPGYVHYHPARWLQTRIGQRIKVDPRCGPKSFLAISADYAVPVLLLGAALAGLYQNVSAMPLFATAGLASWVSRAMPGRAGKAQVSPSLKPLPVRDPERAS